MYFCHDNSGSVWHGNRYFIAAAAAVGYCCGCRASTVRDLASPIHTRHAAVSK